MNKLKPCFRKCVGSNKMLLKEDLIRIVKTSDNQIKIDLTGKEKGRGAYITASLTILQHAKKSKSLQRALRTKLDEAFFQELTATIINLQERLKQ